VEKVKSESKGPLGIGILGGTFDPIHEGHLHIAREALNTLKLDKVLFIPANLSPFKLSDDLTPAPHRLQMVNLAVMGCPLLEVSDIDIRRGGVSYTIDTLRALKPLYPAGTVFYLIMGADAFSQMQDWKEGEKITDYCKVAVAARPSHPLKPSSDCVLITQKILPYSSTEIRRHLEGDKLPPGLLPSVARYIQEHHLYS
jgi:nicotinate-nucleotide adenylyltransferase